MAGLRAYLFVTVGLVLGSLLTQRPWLEPVRASASTVDCFGFNVSNSNDHLRTYVLNRGGSSISVKEITRSLSGSVLDNVTFTVAGGLVGQHNINGSGNDNAALVTFSAGGHILAAGLFISHDDNDAVSITCQNKS